MKKARTLDEYREHLLARREGKTTILREGGARAHGHSQNDIVRIDFALVRIKEGTFGFCCECSCPIEVERLSWKPETPFCASCAQEREKS